MRGDFKPARAAQAGPRFYQVGKFGCADRTATDFHKRSDDSAHHFPEIVRCTNSEKQQIAISLKLDVIDDYDRRAFLSPFVTEAREIPPPRKRPRGFAPRRLVKVVFHPPHKPLGKCCPALGNLIEVCQWG